MIATNINEIDIVKDKLVALHNDAMHKNFPAMFDFREKHSLYSGNSIIVPKHESEINILKNQKDYNSIKNDRTLACLNPILGAMCGSCASVKPNEIAAMMTYCRQENCSKQDFLVTHCTGVYLSHEFAAPFLPQF